MSPRTWKHAENGVIAKTERDLGSPWVLEGAQEAAEDDLPADDTEAVEPDGGEVEGGQREDSELFEPAQHTVDEVLAVLAEADQDEVNRIIASEQGGKNRKGVIAFESE